MGGQRDGARRDPQPGVALVDDVEVLDRRADRVPPLEGDDPARPRPRVHGLAIHPGRAGHRLPQRQAQQRAGADVDSEDADAPVERGHQAGLRAASVGIRAGRRVHHDQVVPAQVGHPVSDEVVNFHVVPEGLKDAGDPLRCSRERVPRVRVRSAAGKDQ
jgi:hypothetical protein